MLRAHHAAHSLPLLFVVAVFARLITGRWPSAPAQAWLLHILIDIPTHSRKQWAPQFLWPLSQFSVDGCSWVELAITALRRVREGRSHHTAVGFTHRVAGCLPLRRCGLPVVPSEGDGVNLITLVCREPRRLRMQRGRRRWWRW